VSDMQPEFVEADRATRLKLLGFVTPLLLLIVLDFLTSSSAALRAADPVRALNKTVARLLIIALISAPFFIGSSIYLLRLAIRVKQSGRWPPPGMRVAVRTQIYRGRRATLNSILMFVLAGLSLVVTPALFYTWHLASRAASNLEQMMTPRSGAADLQRSK
jgi:hypothetical protein